MTHTLKGSAQPMSRRKIVNRPLTLAERRANQYLAELGGYIARPVHPGSTNMLFAAERLFTFRWGDDAMDPLRQDIVTLYLAKSDYLIAKERNDIPESQRRLPGEVSVVACREIPFTGTQERAPQSDRVYVVFESNPQTALNYEGDETVAHLDYRTDSSGHPMAAFASLRGAQSFSTDVSARYVCGVGPYQNFLAVSPTTYAEHLDEITSLARSVFWRRITFLKIPFQSGQDDLQTLAEVFRYVNSAKDIDLYERLLIANELLLLCDRLMLHKIVSMQVETYQELF